MPFFSVIIQSTLKSYPGAASNRPAKLVRAIESVINQTFQDWELIVVADKCQQSFDIASKFNDRIKVVYSPDTFEKWSSHGRNVGIDNVRIPISINQVYCHSKYILYLDNDDYYSSDYLQNLFSAIQEQPATWYIADHFEFVKGEWKMIRANLKMNSAGTANVIHASTMLTRWPDSSHYGTDDWTFIRGLMNESKDYKHLDLAGYFIAHKRNEYDR